MTLLFKARVAQSTVAGVVPSDVAPDSPLAAIMESDDEEATGAAEVGAVVANDHGSCSAICVSEKQRVYNHVMGVMHCLSYTIAQNKLGALMDLGRTWVKTPEMDHSEVFFLPGKDSQNDF